jgi:hypothetical protein
MLAGVLRDFDLERRYGKGWNIITANRINQFNASGLYPAFDMMFLFASTSTLL